MEARLGLALVDEKLGRKNDALDEYNRVVEMFPDSAVCYAARAAFVTTLSQHEAALFDWDEAIRRQPLHADYVVTKVSLLLKLGRTGEARKTLDEALQRGVPRVVLKEWIDKCRNK
jgi:tetratricopeptide (TPR) repeat protein